MAKLTKAESKAHLKAERMLEQDVLTMDEKHFVLENWHESANEMNAIAGAFFTPAQLASDFSLEIGPGSTIDLCAGIGMLSFYRQLNSPKPMPMTCVEINRRYVEVGKKILPEARWIHADALSALDLDLGTFDVAISNPPFGRIARSFDSPRYHGPDFEYHILDIAAHIARLGAFILPQESAPFRYSGQQSHVRAQNGRAVQFETILGARMEASSGIDTAFYKNDWKFKVPNIEVVIVEFPVMTISAAEVLCLEAAE